MSEPLRYTATGLGTYSLDQTVAEEIDEVEAYVFGLLMALDTGDEPLDLTGTPFCGCGRCIARAHAAYIIPRILLAQRDGLAELVD